MACEGGGSPKGPLIWAGPQKGGPAVEVAVMGKELPRGEHTWGLGIVP